MTPYIILFTLICSFLSQKLIPKFMNSTIIHDGEQIQNKIGPHEIFVYQFETNSLDVLFLFRGIEKRTLIYGYEAKNIEELQLKESNLLRYLSQNVLYDFTIIDNYCTQFFSIGSINQLNNTNQFIVIVYCPLDVSCEYFISFFNYNKDFSYTINAIDNQSFLFQFLPRNNYLFTFTLPNNLTENTDIIFSLNTTIYSGVVNIKEVTINNRKQNISWNVKGVQEMLSLPVDKDSTIQIKLNALYSGFVILNYRFSEELITNIEIDITKVYSILNNSKKVFILPKYSFFENASILLNIKSENCNMKITELSNKAILLSESQIYYQYRFIEADDYPIEVYLHNEENKNEKCTFYTYATQNEISYKVLAMEGISYRIKITKYLELISFQLPYIYHSELSDSINILFSISDNKDAYIDIIIQHYSVYSQCINGNNINVIISNWSLKGLCLENTICIINIYLSSVKSEDDFYVDFKISANRQVLHYIPFNTIIKDTFSQQFTRLFYTFIKQNDEGRIKLIYQNKALPMKYKVINKKSISRDDIINENWNEYFIDEGRYQLKEECINECFLVISLSNDNDNMDYFLFVENISHYIKAPNNEKIKGTFDYDKEKYTFRFSLNNINKFQIILGGSLVKYQLLNIESSAPCCDTFNETYYPEEGNTFIDTFIGETKENITIEIVAISTNPDPYLSYFEITVLPFEFSNYPLYYISDKKSINCYTGKEGNKSYIIIKLGNSDTYYYSTSFYGLQPQYFDLYYKCIDYLDEENRINIESNIDKSSSIHYKELYGTLIYSKELCLIMIETEKNTKFTFQISSQENGMYLISNEKKLFVLKHNEKQQIIIPNNVNNLQNNYTYLLDIEQIKGVGVINFFTNEQIIGKKVYYLSYSDLLIKSNFTITSENTELMVNIKLSMISSSDFSQIKMVNYTSTCNFMFNNNPFPLYFGIKLKDTMTSLMVNIRLRNDFSKNNKYSFNNLKFSAFYTNKESFDLYNNHQGELKTIKELIINNHYNHPVINIEEFDSTIFSQYPYLIIKVEENITTIDWIYSYIQFDISPYVTYSYDYPISLTEKRYHYYTMINSYQQYLLNSISSYIFIEFSSCSDSNYNMYFTNIVGEPLEESRIHINKENNEYGRKTIWIDNIKNESIILNLSLADSIVKTDYFILKYSNQIKPYSTAHFYFDNITLDYFPIGKIISSRWDTIKDNTNKNVTINAEYYYYLYEYKENTHSKSSICQSSLPFDFKSIFDNKLNWTNTSIPYSIIENVIIAYFSLENEDFLVSYYPKEVHIISSSNLWLWIILIFVIILLIIGYGTYLFYQELKKKESQMSIKEQYNELKKE